MNPPDRNRNPDKSRLFFFFFSFLFFLFFFLCRYSCFPHLGTPLIISSILQLSLLLGRIQHHTRRPWLPLWVIPNTIVQYDSVCLYQAKHHTRRQRLPLWLIFNIIQDGRDCPSETYPTSQYSTTVFVSIKLNITQEGSVCLSGSYLTSYKTAVLTSPFVPTGSPSRGGDVAVYVFDINQPSLPTPFCSVFLCLFLSLWPFQLYFIR